MLPLNKELTSERLLRLEMLEPLAWTPGRVLHLEPAEKPGAHLNI